MAWKLNEYNLQSMRGKTTREITDEYERIRKEVKKDISGFKRHKQTDLPFVKSVMSSMNNNSNRRQMEHAIIDMKRFQMLQVHTYEDWNNSINETIKTWSEAGVENLSRRNIKNFLKFLEWVKSFQQRNYRMSDVKEAYEKAHHSVKGAMIIFANMQDESVQNSL